MYEIPSQILVDFAALDAYDAPFFGARVKSPILFLLHCLPNLAESDRNYFSAEETAVGVAFRYRCCCPVSFLEMS